MPAADEFPHEPRLGRRGRAWFRCRVRAAIRDLARKREDAVQFRGLIPSLVEWYAEELYRYLHWEPYDTYRGPWYPTGLWVLNGSAVERDLSVGLRACQRAAEAKAHPTLDAWLAALHAGALRAPVPSEPSAWRYLTTYEASERLDKTQRHLATWWPKLCACGQSFSGPSRSTKRCPDCRGKAKRLQPGGQP